MCEKEKAELVEKFMDDLKLMLKAQADYNKIMVSVGYAGFFTTLSVVQKQLSSCMLNLSVALIAISLIFYIIILVLDIIIIQETFRFVRKEVSTEDVLKKFGQLSENKFLKKIPIIQYVLFYSCIGAGLPAGVIIAYNALMHFLK